MHASWLSWGRAVLAPQKGQEVTKGLYFPLLLSQGHRQTLQEYLHASDESERRKHRRHSRFE